MLLVTIVKITIVNYYTTKVCLKPQRTLKNDKYLLRALKADPFYSYFKEENRILMSIDSPEWIDFFINKEKM